MTLELSLPALDGAQRVQYDRDGYTIVRGLFSPADMESLAGDAESLLARHDLIDTDNLRCRWQPNVETGECRFECFDPVVDISPECHRVAHDPRLFAVLASIYGEAPCLFKDKLIFKPPKVKGYDLHQDYIAWPNFPTTFLTVVIPIDVCDCSNGCTEVFPGYHHQGYLSPKDGDYHPLPAGAVDESRGVPLELMPGDIAIFGCFTPHRSAPNRSDRWRRQLYLSYNAASDGGPRRTQHYEEFHVYLRKRYAEHGRPNPRFR
jgi:2-aminoethylphosphonate dioxygenase